MRLTHPDLTPEKDDASVKLRFGGGDRDAPVRGRADAVSRQQHKRYFAAVLDSSHLDHRSPPQPSLFKRGIWALKHPEHLTLSIILILSSCAQQGVPAPVVVPGSATGLDTQARKVTPTALPGVFFLPPVAPNPGVLGPLEANARVNIEFFKLEDGKTPGKALGPGYSVKAGTIAQDGGKYHANWKTSDSEQVNGTTVRIELRLDNAPAGEPVCHAGVNLDAGCLAFIDAKLWRNQGEANQGAKSNTLLNLVNGQTIPLKFHVNADAINQAPRVTIKTPATGATLDAQPVTFTASALDFEDGDLTANVEWRAGEQVLGQGGTIETVLPAGAHTVTAHVADRTGKAGQASVQFTVKPSAPTMTLTKMQPDRGPLTGGTTVTLTGTGFTGATSVQFGTQPATNFKVISDAEIQAVAPQVSAPATVNVTVQKNKAASAALPFTYGESYEIIARGTDDRMLTLLNGKVVSDVEYSWGTPVPQASVYAKDGDKVELVLVNRWPTHCGIGQVIAKTPSGVVKEIHPGFSNPNCTDRLGEVFRYEYVLPDGPGKELPIQAPDVTELTTVAGLAGAPTTFQWTAAHPQDVKLQCTLEFGDGQTQTLDPCDRTGAVRHIYAQPGTYSAKLKVADGPYTSGLGGDATSGNSNSIQKFVSVSVAPAPAPAKVSLVDLTPRIGSTLGGTAVTLTGKGFTGTTEVKFGTLSAAKFTVVNDTTILAVTPAFESPTEVAVSVTSAEETSNTLPFTYRIPYRLSALARPLNSSIYQYFDDRLVVQLNDRVIADMKGENLTPGDYPPRILTDFAANAGDKLTFVVVNGWPWACGSGQITLLKPDGQTTVAYPGFTDPNCNDRIGEVARYEYILPDGPGKSVPIQAPDIETLTVTGAAGAPTTFTWKLTNPTGAKLTCTLDFGNGQTRTVDPCSATGSVQHTYASAGTYRAKLKVVDGPYASGDPYDTRSGESNGIQKFVDVVVASQPVNQAPVVEALTISPSAAQMGQTVTLSWNTIDPEKEAVSCTVSFGDGQVQTVETCLSATAVNHVYAGAGTYTVTIKAADVKGNVTEKTVLVTVTQAAQNTPPVIQHVATVPSAPQVGGVVTFTWQVTDANHDAVSCVISFGDGTTKTVQTCQGTTSATHTYTKSGNYTVKVTASDARAATTEFAHSITVVPAPVKLQISSLAVQPALVEVGDYLTVSWQLTNPNQSALSCTIRLGSQVVRELQSCDINTSTVVQLTQEGSQLVTLSINDPATGIVETSKQILVHPDLNLRMEGTAVDLVTVQGLLQQVQASPYLPSGAKFSLDRARAVSYGDNYAVLYLKDFQVNPNFDQMLHEVFFVDGKIVNWVRLAKNNSKNEVSLVNVLYGTSFSGPVEGRTAAQDQAANLVFLQSPMSQENRWRDQLGLVGQTGPLSVNQAGRLGVLTVSCSDLAGNYRNAWVLAMTGMPFTVAPSTSSANHKDFFIGLFLEGLADAGAFANAFAVYNVAPYLASMYATHWFVRYRDCLSGQGINYENKVIAVVAPPLPASTTVFVKSVPDNITVYATSDVMTIADILAAALPNAVMTYEALYEPTIIESATVDPIGMTIRVTIKGF